MSAPVFDAYLVIDWSASNCPKRGKDSIWIGAVRREGARLVDERPLNPRTRAEAMALVADRLEAALRAGRRVFTGFDFPFGYPAGAAAHLAGAARWDALWRALMDNIHDTDQNRSNRFDVAAAWNARLPEPFYWGRPPAREIHGLTATKPRTDGFRACEFRIVERWRRPAKSVWQLLGAGAVGGQAMLGIARLEALRQTLASDAAVWPFETCWADDLAAPVLIAEVYPSMFAIDRRADEVLDAAQVRTLARRFAALDAEGRLAPWLSRPAGLGEADNARVLAEEGWIVGVGHQ